MCPSYTVIVRMCARKLGNEQRRMIVDSRAMKITKKACARGYHPSQDESWKDVAHGFGMPTLAKALLGLGLRRYWSGVTRGLT
jgi:hypothetical protein